MPSTSVKIEWLPKGCEQFFKYNAEVEAILMEQGKAIAEKNCAEAGRHIHDKNGFKKEPYVAEVRRLEHTQVCVIHSTNKIAAAIGRKHRLPKK